MYRHLAPGCLVFDAASCGGVCMYENVGDSVLFSNVLNISLPYFLKACTCEDAQQDKALIVPFLL